MRKAIFSDLRAFCGCFWSLIPSYQYIEQIPNIISLYNYFILYTVLLDTALQHLLQYLSSIQGAFIQWAYLWQLLTNQHKSSLNTA